MKPEGAKTKLTAGVDMKARDAARGYADADLADVMDSPEWSDEQLRGAKPFVEVFPEMAASIQGDRKPPGR